MEQIRQAKSRRNIKMLQKIRTLALILSFTAVAMPATAINAVPDDPLDQEVAPGITQRDFLAMRKQIEMEYNAAQEAARTGKQPKRILSPYSKDSATGLSNEELADHKTRVNAELRKYVLEEFMREKQIEAEQDQKLSGQKSPVPTIPVAMQPKQSEHQAIMPMAVQPAQNTYNAPPKVYMISDEAKKQNKAHEDVHVNIEDVQVFIDKENIKLSEAISEIVKLTEAHAGHWDVKWRLSHDNREIKDQLVNLTAEATFSEFMDYLLERIRNMTGVSLFVKKFETSRVIVISDVY